MARCLWAQAGVVAALLSLSACSPAERKIRLGIAAQQSVSQIPVYLAAQLDLYRSRGLTVELVEFPGASKGMEALLGGSIDVLSGYYTQALAVNAQGRNIEPFLCFYDSLLVALAVAPGKPLHRIEDLKGAKVGVTTLGSATHQFLDFLLRRHNLQPYDVTPIAIGTASRAAAAMERGLVDAGVVTDFTIRYLRSRFGNVELLADTRTRAGTKLVHGVHAFPGTALMASATWRTGNREQERLLAEAVWEAVEWMRAHPVDAVVNHMPATHYGEDREAYTEAVRIAIPMLSLSPNIDPAAAQAARSFLAVN